MSLRTSLDSTIPEETVRVARAAFPKGNVFMQMRDALGPLYTNTPFASLFSPTGQPAEDPARLALILVMQFAEGLSDHQAADAVRGRNEASPQQAARYQREMHSDEKPRFLKLFPLSGNPIASYGESVRLIGNMCSPWS